MKPLIIIGVLIAIAPGCDSDPEYPIIPVIPTPQWMGLSGGQHFVRVLSDGEYDVLVAYSTDLNQWKPPYEHPPPDILSPTVYSIKPNHGKVDVVSKEIWIANSGPIQHALKSAKASACQSWWHLDWVPSPENDSKPSHKLQFKGSVVPTGGQTVLWTESSPDGTLLAVLSAAGKRRGSLSPFGSPRISGHRIHEVFDCTTGQRIGPALELETETHNDTIRPVWSPDQKYVVYHEFNFAIWIVPVGDEKGSK